MAPNEAGQRSAEFWVIPLTPGQDSSSSLPHTVISVPRVAGLKGIKEGVVSPRPHYCQVLSTYAPNGSPKTLGCRDQPLPFPLLRVIRGQSPGVLPSAQMKMAAGNRWTLLIKELFKAG